MSRPLLLSVVVPVYNQADSILANVDTIIDFLSGRYRQIERDLDALVVDMRENDDTEDQKIGMKSFAEEGPGKAKFVGR